MPDQSTEIPNFSLRMVTGAWFVTMARELCGTLSPGVKMRFDTFFPSSMPLQGPY